MLWRRVRDAGLRGILLVLALLLAPAATEAQQVARFERLPQLALELVKLRPDVIVALGAAEVIGRAFGGVLAVNGPTRPNKAPRRRL